MKKNIILFFVTFFLLFLIFIQIKSPLALFQIQSGSMMPKLEIDEIILLSKNKKYELNDIITYKVQNSYFITHRIVKIMPDGYITKGDFNNTEDKDIVKYEQVEGKVIFHSKVLGKIYKYRYYLIGICILLSIIERRKNAIKKRKSKK